MVADGIIFERDLKIRQYYTLGILLVQDLAEAGYEPGAIARRLGWNRETVKWICDGAHHSSDVVLDSEQPKGHHKNDDTTLDKTQKQHHICDAELDEKLQERLREIDALHRKNWGGEINWHIDYICYRVVWAALAGVPDEFDETVALVERNLSELQEKLMKAGYKM